MPEFGPGPLSFAGGGAGQFGQGVGVQVFAHVARRDVPDGEKNALSLVVACTLLMRLAEIAECDRSVDGRDDLGESDLTRIACEHVPAAHAALGPHETGTLQGEQDLLQVRLGQTGALGDVTNRRRSGRVAVERQGQQGAAGVITACGHSHDAIVGAGLWR